MKQIGLEWLQLSPQKDHLPATSVVARIYDRVVGKLRVVLRAVFCAELDPSNIFAEVVSCDSYSNIHRFNGPISLLKLFGEVYT